MPKSILIVDDEPRIRTLLRQSLEDLEDDGAAIYEAENGLQAIELLRAHRPTVVLLDVMMPGMNGYEVCEVIKNDRVNRPYVLMLTARGQHFDRVRGQMSGADHYMTKPFDPEDVEAIVRYALEANAKPESITAKIIALLSGRST